MFTNTDALHAIGADEVVALIRNFGDDPDLPHLCIPVAGLQYYDYDNTDEIMGALRPNCGDRLELVRRPDNPFDPNAIELRWRNGQYHLGHLPMQYAEQIAPLIDRGHAVRAYALNPGTGKPWSVWAVLIATNLPTIIS